MDLDETLVQELREAYDKVAANGEINKDNVGNVFKEAGEGIPAFRLRDACQNINKGGNENITFEDFVKMCEALNLNKLKGRKLKDNVQSKTGVQTVSGYEQTSAGTKHSVSDAEKASFSRYINKLLAEDPDCKKYLPLDPKTDDLYKALNDGIILCKLVNLAQPNTIDERAINKKKINNFTSTENLVLAINSSSAIGCHVVNIDSEDIKQGRVHLILGLMWQIIRIAIFQFINIKCTPDLLCMLKEGETPQQFMALSPEELLLRWVNYQIEKVGCTKTVNNFGADFKDSYVYSCLEQAIMKDHMIHSATKIQGENDLLKKGNYVVQNAEKAGVIALASAEDIVGGFTNLNMVFVADMFNKYPNLQVVEEPAVIEETREEKSYRNWLNSLGVKPFVTYFYNDLSDGIVLLQAFDILSPKSVVWDKVNKPPFKANTMFLKKTENCNKVVDLAKKHNFSTVNLSGQDIANSSQQHILSIVCQMMSRYNLQILQELSKSMKPMTDAEIIGWANQKFKDAGKDLQISSFKDPNVVNSKAIFYLVDIIKPGTVDPSMITESEDVEEKLSNAKLAISLSRKVGAAVYALPEDVVESKTKMVMTIFACLMIADYSKK